MYEHSTNPLLPRKAFYWRLINHGLVSSALVLFSLGLGIFGYRQFESQAWVDALVNAAMLMGGMGPVSELHTNAGKVFASIYALYCGLIFIVAAGFIFLPILHRLLHHFHVETDEFS